MKVVMVDDEPKKRLSEAIRGIPNVSLTEFHNLDKAFNYVLENHWAVDLMLIDQVFANRVEGSVLQSGLDLGAAVTQHFPYIPMVMFTGNAYTPEITKAAFRTSGYIDFFHKSDINDRTILTILANLQLDSSYLDKIQLRKSLKREQIISFFKNNITPGIRKRLLTPDSIQNKTFINSKDVVDLKLLFEGYLQLGSMTDRAIHSIILEFLHATEEVIVFNGEWKTGSENRALLASYETDHNYIDRRNQIEYETINFLLNVLDLISEYDICKGGRSLKIKGDYYDTITTSCKPNDPYCNLYFQQKMIGRRSAIVFSEMRGKDKDPLSMHNLILLLKSGETGMFTVETHINGEQYREYQEQRSGTRANHILNSILGLSLTKIPPMCFRNDRNVREECCDYTVNVKNNHILYEERQFLNKYRDQIADLRDFLDRLELPHQVKLNHNLKGRKIQDLYKLDEILKGEKEISPMDYVSTVKTIFEQAPEKLHSNLAHFLKIKPIT